LGRFGFGFGMSGQTTLKIMSKPFMTPPGAMPNDKRRYNVKDILVIITAWLITASLVYALYLKIKYLHH